MCCSGLAESTFVCFALSSALPMHVDVPIGGGGREEGGGVGGTGSSSLLILSLSPAEAPICPT